MFTDPTSCGEKIERTENATDRSLALCADPQLVSAKFRKWAHAKGVLHGKVLAIDATTLEANAAMKSSGCG
jgi:hypothetical protein